MKITTKLPLLIITLFAIACSEDESSTPVKELKLDYYVEYFQFPGQEFKPSAKTVYGYDATGNIEYTTVFSYNTAAQDFIEERTYHFRYENGTLEKIEAYLVDASSPYLIYEYQFTDGKVSEIKEQALNAGTFTTATFHYPAVDSIRVEYRTSNGNGFDYALRFNNNHTALSKTTRFGQLCSEGTYGFDQAKNPFATLGYTDFLLNNVSPHNKVYENISYVGCAFPELVPMFYEHEYLDEKLPTESTTIYKRPDGTGPRSKKEFFYVRD